MSQVSSFLLTKWYLDCLEPNGDGAIIYVADLCWKALRMRYASTMTFADGKVESATSIRKCLLPEDDGERIVLRLPQLGMEGVWEGSAPPAERTIFENQAGAIQWNCLQPASHVTLTLRGRKIEGLGYAELLRMTVPPWKLPLNELHWGRFVSESGSLVWIDWRGSHQYSLLLHNGVEQRDVSIAEHEVQGSNAHLTLDQRLVLRSGELGKTVFPLIRRLMSSIPASMLQIKECKWRSRGQLREAERSTTGWVIHEVVRWQEK